MKKREAAIKKLTNKVIVAYETVETMFNFRTILNEFIVEFRQ